MIASYPPVPAGTILHLPERGANQSGSFGRDLRLHAFRRDQREDPLEQHPHGHRAVGLRRVPEKAASTSRPPAGGPAHLPARPLLPPPSGNGRGNT